MEGFPAVLKLSPFVCNNIWKDFSIKQGSRFFGIKLVQTSKKKHTGTHSLVASGIMPTICPDVISKTRSSWESNWNSGPSASSAKYIDCVYHIITFPLLLCLLVLQVWARTALAIKGFLKNVESKYLDSKLTVGLLSLMALLLISCTKGKFSFCRRCVCGSTASWPPKREMTI